MKSVTEIRKDIEEKTKPQYGQRVPSELMSDKELLHIRDIFLGCIEKEVEKAIANDPYKTQCYCTLRTNNIIFDKKLLEKFRQHHLVVFAMILDELNTAGYIIDSKSSEITWDAGADNYVIQIKMELYRFTEEQKNSLENLDLASFIVGMICAISGLVFAFSFSIAMMYSLSNSFAVFQSGFQMPETALNILAYAVGISITVFLVLFWTKIGIEKIHEHLQKKCIKNYAKE